MQMTELNLMEISLVDVPLNPLWVVVSVEYPDADS
jgi:hypothetical protein